MTALGRLFKSILLSFTKVHDAHFLNVVIPAQAGIQCLLTDDTGFPPARERREFCDGCHAFP
jgi:hypothetical protein